MSDETVDRHMVLVADDDHDLVRLVARRLTKAGFDVVTATDGAEALEAARGTLPDLVVLDVMMPRLTGVEVMRELRADAATVSIPIILVSASLPPNPANDAAFAGADGYIQKPFGTTELPERVRDVLQRTTAK